MENKHIIKDKNKSLAKNYLACLATRSPNNKGFSIIEALLAVSIAVLFVSFLIGGLAYSQESSFLAGKRTRAVFLAEEGLEAARNIRDNSFGNLTDGSYGLAIAGNEWNFAGASDTTEIFTRTINISAVNADTKLVSASVSWPQTAQRAGNISLETYFTNWKPF